jgi:type IV fimbrial biogenesis protein FimT
MENKGFTLYELVISLAVISITMAVALPSLNKTLQQTRTKTTALEFLSAIEQARSTAVFRSTRSVITAKTEWHEGWTIFQDADDDGVLDSNEPVISDRGKIDGVVITGNFHVRKLISFIDTGESRTPGRSSTGTIAVGTLTICPTTAGPGYTIVLSKGGRSRIKNITKIECDAARR